MQGFECACGQPLFFDSFVCERCGRPVGFAPDRQRMVTLETEPRDAADLAVLHDRDGRYRFCRNGEEHAVCNWLIPTGQADDLCQACQLNRTVPDLGQPANLRRWGRLEAAKRRLVYTLLAMRLPVASRLKVPEWGLAFDFLEDRRSNPAMPVDFVATGHADGVITINLLEADPVEQVRARERLHEQYRTLLGHMRHESGHYYWDLLVRDGPALDGFRERFGDERTDYRAALDRHYQQGAPADWSERFISAYASAHPWEDWAETWAHYLHMTDSLETARAFGVVDDGEKRAPEAFDVRVERWAGLMVTLNELNRSMGQDDPYPFVITPTVVDKLRFVHETLEHAVADPRIASDGLSTAGVADHQRG